MKILIIGFGDIGEAVGKTLTDQGHAVTALKRSKIAYHDSIQADITKPLSCRKDFDYVLYIVTPASRDEVGYRAVFEKGLANSLDYFSESLFYFISSTAVYGQDDGSWVDETSPTSQETMRAKVLTQAETQVLDYHDKNVVLRLSGIYGRGERYLLDKLQRQEPIQHTPPYYTNRIHSEDAVGAICHIMISQIAGSLKERVFNVADSTPLTMYGLMTLFAQKEGLADVPKAKMKDDASQNKRIANHRLLESGYTLAYPSYFNLSLP